MCVNSEKGGVYTDQLFFPLQLLTDSQSTSMYMMDHETMEKQRGGVTYG